MREGGTEFPELGNRISRFHYFTSYQVIAMFPVVIVINEFMRYAENPVLKLCCGFCRLRCLSSGHKAGVVYYVTTCPLLPSLHLSPICLYLSFSLFICICICLSLPKILPIYLSHSFSPAAFLPSFPCSQPWLANDGLSGGSEWWI